MPLVNKVSQFGMRCSCVDFPLLCSGGAAMLELFSEPLYILAQVRQKKGTHFHQDVCPHCNAATAQPPSEMSVK